MNTKNYTAQPWTLLESSSSPGEFRLFALDLDLVELGTIRGKENARLAELAPELLLSLKHAVRVLEVVAEKTPMIRASIRALEETIAKAQSR